MAETCKSIALRLGLLLRRKVGKPIRLNGLSSMLLCWRREVCKTVSGLGLLLRGRGRPTEISVKGRLHSSLTSARHGDHSWLLRRIAKVRFECRRWGRGLSSWRSITEISLECRCRLLILHRPSKRIPIRANLTCWFYRWRHSVESEQVLSWRWCWGSHRFRAGHNLPPAIRASVTGFGSCFSRSTLASAAAATTSRRRATLTPLSINVLRSDPGSNRILVRFSRHGHGRPGIVTREVACIHRLVS